MVLDDCIGRREEDAFVAVLPADQVGRRAVVAMDLDDVAMAGLVPLPAPLNRQSIAQFSLHGCPPRGVSRYHDQAAARRPPGPKGLTARASVPGGRCWRARGRDRSGTRRPSRRRRPSRTPAARTALSSAKRWGRQAGRAGGRCGQGGGLTWGPCRGAIAAPVPLSADGQRRAIAWCGAIVLVSVAL